MSKILIALALLISLTACGSLEKSIGIDETDNALQCVRLQVSSSNPFVPGQGTTKRVEMPSSYDSNTLSDESLARLMEWCD